MGISKTESRCAKMTDLGIVVLNSNLLLANSAPELDGQLCDILLLALHTHDAEAKESLLHVEAHLLVVCTHDTVQASERTSLHADLIGLGGLADHLHDIVALALVLHVGSHTIETMLARVMTKNSVEWNLQVNGVAKGSNSGIANVHVRLLAPSTLNNGSKDGI